MMGARRLVGATIRTASATGGPGSWGFEDPEEMQSRVQRNGRLLQMTWARCAGTSSVGNCRAGMSSIEGAGTSSIVEIDCKSSDVEILFFSEAG